MIDSDPVQFEKANTVRRASSIFRWDGAHSGAYVLRSLALIVVDSLAWAAALTLAMVARFEFVYSRVDFGGLTNVIAIAVVAQLVWGLVAGLYPGRWRLASFLETGVVAAGGLLISAGLFSWVLHEDGIRRVPLSVTLASPALFMLFALGARFLVRLSRDLRSVSRHPRYKRALFFGAGEAGHEAVEALMRDPEAEIQPVAFLDDNPARSRLRVGGCRVVGNRNDIAETARRFDADTLVITMPSAPRAAVAEVARIARNEGLDVLILPRMARFLSPEAAVGSIRHLTFSDFLGRDPVRLDLAGMARFIEGRRVLITGAGGSIGSELAAAVRRFSPERLFLLDRDENGLHGIQLRLEGRAMLDTDDLIVANIREADRIREVFEQCTPDVVFHAAALKHVPLLERFPVEAVKTNILGTANVLQMAALVGVDRFVNISTDKAADPVNILGLTKRIGEMLTSSYTDSGMTALSVRFGNVLGSSGSVIPTFRAQIARGGPVTITHPDVTRYFMTIEEAAHLVVQAAVLGRRGEVLVLDMGKPVRIVDLARDLIAELDPGAEIEIVYTGLRPGEKLHELLVGPGERSTGQPHEAIAGYAVPPLSPGLIENLDLSDPVALRAHLEHLIAEPLPQSIAGR